MHLKSIALLSGAAVLGLAMGALPASAAGKKQTSVATSSTDLSSQSRRRVRVAERPRTRITIRRRSFLDPGTEVLPGERKFTDYAFPPGYEPMRVVSGVGNSAGFQNPWYPLPGAHFPWPP